MRFKEMHRFIRAKKNILGLDVYEVKSTSSLFKSNVKPSLLLWHIAASGRLWKKSQILQENLSNSFGLSYVFVFV